MNIIVAVDRNWAIGKGGDQLVYISEDLKRFKALTLGHGVILGRKTLATFPGGRPLKGRDNFILSANPDFQAEGAVICRNLEQVRALAAGDAFVIGGESVYRALLSDCHTAYVTKIDREFEADAWFPNLDEDPHWEIRSEEGPYADGELMFHYVTYQRV